MTIFENQNVELKQEYVPEIRKEVIAFANADGGTLIIGIRKDGEVCGIDDPDETMLQVANSLKDAIALDIMPFVKIQTILMDGKNVVEIMVSTGTNRPYYIKEKGLKTSGVYVRKGCSFQPNGAFFELNPGRNKVQCTGLYLNRVWITPNWWTV